MNTISRDLTRYAHATWQAEPADLTPPQLHEALAHCVLHRISSVRRRSAARHDSRRRAYYLSAEYLMGRLIHNNLLCSGLLDEATEALVQAGIDPARLEDVEDAALGNGGLGRLAACYLDAAATCSLPLDGYGIRYRFGLFRQRFADGFQLEQPDDWTRYGDPWSVRREEDTVTVYFADRPVRAVPYDMPVIGYGGGHVVNLRLWQAEPMAPFDFGLFNDQKYDRALQEKNRAEDLSRVLYPNDSTPAGKLLRLSQQYFFASASMQDILRRYEATCGKDFSLLSRAVSIQLNDTHPVIAVPELVRLLLERGLPFNEAANIATTVFNYTNHTVMAEALEVWDLALIRKVSPEIAKIIRKLSTRFDRELDAFDIPAEDRPRLQILQDGRVHMAHLACRYSNRINGVAALHTQILKQDVLRRWHTLYPNKILNITNGITPRRWLRLCNPALSALLTHLLGSEDWVTDLPQLAKLSPFAADETVLDRFIAVKQENKRHLATILAQKEGVVISSEWMLDVQIKRLHEYKRQLLNILCILELYFEIKEGTLTDYTPTVFLFGAKAAPGYARAKGIIKLCHEVARLIADDPVVSRYLQVVFVTDYNVSYAERIVAAADVSEQISTAGTEASGTGNMKLMLNGAVTLGTYDGANIEIVREAGEENNYIFGARVEDLAGQKHDPKRLYEQDARIRRCVDALVDGTLDDGGTGLFAELRQSLLEGASWHAPDHYYVLGDFNACLEMKKRVAKDYARDRRSFAAKQWRNLCAAGVFSADRAIREYAKEIWEIR
ncbi:MAG: glycogen/starch/alpha-glucan family phosphorylase [Clostridia bacterium]|nr:glycogen/starch/alpha-glucan family phosphorylase [Clostridia bacterium]